MDATEALHTNQAPKVSVNLSIWEIQIYHLFGDFAQMLLIAWITGYSSFFFSNKSLLILVILLSSNCE